MGIAFKEANTAIESGEGGPFGAVILKDGKVIAKAHNEVLISHDPTAHAEIRAIQHASKVLKTHDLSGCILYTTCYPCPMCMGAILWARIPMVYYASTMEDAAEGGFDDATFYALMHNPQKSLDLRMIDFEEGKALFKKWNEKEDKKLY